MGTDVDMCTSKGVLSGNRFLSLLMFCMLFVQNTFPTPTCFRERILMFWSKHVPETHF